MGTRNNRLADAALTSPHNLCFGSKIRKIRIPLQTPVFPYKNISVLSLFKGVYMYIARTCYPGPEVIKLFSCSAQLRLKFILLRNVKMPTIVGILTFISRINYRLWNSKPSISIYLGNFSIYEELKFQAQLS